MPPSTPLRSRPTPAETTGPVPPVPSDAGRETVRGTWTPPAPNAPRPTPQPAAAEKPDPFADLPRITPFTEFELDPIETRPAPPPNGYTGRRRASAEEAGAEAEAGSGRHSQSGTHVGAGEPAGRRHRRAEENGEANELLAKLLARESAQR